MKSTHSNILETMIKTLLAIGLLTTSAIIPTPKNYGVSAEPLNVPTITYKKVWTCPDCNPREKYVLSVLQDRTKISDLNALSTIMGNIKQESKFNSNICEGGSRIPYDSCHKGGYGLIQWTTKNRYDNLGKFGMKYNCDPSSLECQTLFMINEYQFQSVLLDFEGGGQTVRQYMKPAYYWLGWGIKGNREIYAYDYTKKLVLL